MTSGSSGPGASSGTTPGTDGGHPDVVVGVAGLGNLGLPVARRLACAGFEVLGFDVNPGARASAEGLPLAASVRELAEKADVVFILVSDGGQCRSVLSGPDGIASASRPPAAVVIMATVGPDALTELAAELRGRETDIIDAPVSGGSEAATDGSLSLMVGGSPEVIQRWRAPLAALGTVHVMGPLGAGQSAKVANQMVFFGTQAVLQEALALANASGVNQDALLAALSGGTADCWSVRHPGFLEATARAYDASGVDPSHRSWHKDLRTAVQATAARDLNAPVTDVVNRVFGDRIDKAARRPSSPECARSQQH
ncbi:hypothetical protein GCM10027404_33540 [Arthrobacter tumbae]|uniref:NAD(P)-dependent oxidoreductase n=1 Tax=Arthrobacter tumbae TaxID=163874 RepID=UPI001959ECEE|nr:NAD(P)-dependent oxidoreductase [Arthrobacter tumbae]MBM7781950.1 3-hydroxyisobutyrate dehydrogenase-like beta-hydroxyacid dehydrogenase [Arthrobacter tumbae]